MNRRAILSSILVLTLLGNLMFFAFTPVPASAAIKSSIAGFTGCYVAGQLTPYLKEKLDQGVKYLKEKATELLKGYLGDFVSGFFGGVSIGAGVGLVVPVQDTTVAGNVSSLTGTYVQKEIRNTIIARCLARQIMIAMTGNVLQVVRTGGRDGGPTYVKNWTNFQTNAQYRGENIFRAELSTAHLCDYLATDVKKAYGVDPKTKTPITGQNTRSDSLQPFSIQSNCTLPSGFTTKKYQQDFAGNGGWDAFVRLLEPQNNLWGLSVLSQNEIQKQRALAVNGDLNQVVANNGHLGISGNGKNDSCQVRGPTGECLVYKDIKTPGSYIATSLGASIGAEYAWLTTAQGLNTIIANATEVLLNRLLDLGNSDEGQYRQTSDGGTDPTATDVPGPPPPADALTKHPDQTGVVTSVKATLVSQGVDLSGPCGAFAIVKNVAWQLRGSGAGLLSKPGGNNCQGYATDIIAFPDGYIYDILGDSGNANTPGWGPSGCGTNGTCADKYAPAIDPGSPGSSPTPTPNPRATPPDFSSPGM